LEIWNKMDNSAAFFRSGGSCPIKKREKSRAVHLRLDMALQINASRSGDLVSARFFEAKTGAASGRFNGNGLSERPPLADPIDCRAYSGPQGALHLDAKRALEIQIGNSERVGGPSKSIWLAKDGSGSWSIWPSPREKADLKPPAADSYLPYLDTI
jgi:hypothetical protein